MTHARECGWLVAIATVLGAMAALSLPLRLEAVDHTARPVACGSAWHPDRNQPREADRFNQMLHGQNPAAFTLSSYGDQCADRIAIKRRTALAVNGLAAVLVTALELLVRTRRDRIAAVPAYA